MHDNVTIVRGRQTAIRAELDRRGIALKAVAFDSGIDYSTLLTYFPAPNTRDPAQIPGGAIYALCGAVPLDLLSLLLPDGYQIVRAPEDVDHDALCSAINEYSAMKDRSHHPDSEAGREIGPNEDSALREQITAIVSLAA